MCGWMHERQEHVLSAERGDAISELLTHGRSKFFPLVERPSVATALPLSMSMGSAMASGQTDCAQYTLVMPDGCLYTLFRLHASSTRITSEQEQQIDTCRFTERSDKRSRHKRSRGAGEFCLALAMPAKQCLTADSLQISP